MQPLNLDFQTRKSSWPLFGIALLVAVIGATAALIRDYVEVNDELTITEGRVARLKRDLERQRLFDAEASASAATANPTTAKARSRGEWEALFSAFESAADETITLLAFEPGTTEIALRAEAKDFDAITAYLQRLSSSPSLSEVRMSEYELVLDHPRRPFRFSVRANWKGAPQ